MEDIMSSKPCWSMQRGVPPIDATESTRKRQLYLGKQISRHLKSPHVLHWEHAGAPGLTYGTSRQCRLKDAGLLWKTRHARGRTEPVCVLIKPAMRSYNNRISCSRRRVLLCSVWSLQWCVAIPSQSLHWSSSHQGAPQWFLLLHLLDGGAFKHVCVFKLFHIFFVLSRMTKCLE